VSHFKTYFFFELIGQNRERTKKFLKRVLKLKKKNRKMMKVSNFKEIKKSENEEGANFINKNYEASRQN
jgi:predicted enzyme related to lactoylglutathione lyase